MQPSSDPAVYGGVGLARLLVLAALLVQPVLGLVGSRCICPATGDEFIGIEVDAAGCCARDLGNSDCTVGECGGGGCCMQTCDNAGGGPCCAEEPANQGCGGAECGVAAACRVPEGCEGCRVCRCVRVDPASTLLARAARAETKSPWRSVPAVALVRFPHAQNQSWRWQAPVHVAGGATVSERLARTCVRTI